MDKRILVAYGSKRGSTAEIAAKIGEALRRKGLRVDVLDAGAAGDLARYDAVIVGSSVYIGLWHRKVVRFLKKNMERLAKSPVWLFICGPTGPGNPVEQMDGWFYPKSLQPVMDRLHPREITCFGGKLALKSLNSFERMIINKVKAPEGDFRDWQAVESWADAIARAL